VAAVAVDARGRDRRATVDQHQGCEAQLRSPVGLQPGEAIDLFVPLQAGSVGALMRTEASSEKAVVPARHVQRIGRVEGAGRQRSARAPTGCCNAAISAEVGAAASAKTAIFTGHSYN
jgi:hypothetical protein